MLRVFNLYLDKLSWTKLRASSNYERKAHVVVHSVSLELETAPLRLHEIKVSWIECCCWTSIALNDWLTPVAEWLGEALDIEWTYLNASQGRNISRKEVKCERDESRVIIDQEFHISRNAGDGQRSRTQLSTWYGTVGSSH